MHFLEYLFIFLSLILLNSCSDKAERLLEMTATKYHHPEDYAISINTNRSPFNLLDKDSMLFDYKNFMRRSTRSMDDYFTVEKDVSSNETVVLPEYIPHVWLGNVLYRSSVADCTYRPFSVSKKPEVVTLNLMGAEPCMINNPSYSKYASYIKQQIPKLSFKQNDDFFFSMEQFTSYNELKSTFGSNVNIGSLFFDSTLSSSGIEHHINKLTGIYLKFWQSSFTAIMDTPDIPFANIPAVLMDSAVYINSITYGRFGLLTLETNEEVNYAKQMLQKSFHTLFTKGSSYLTNEEKNFLNGCDFKVYLIGGNGATAVQSFYGFTGFVDHIIKGHFSNEQPGQLIFCTFANVADNSLARIKFKYNIRREPLYVDIIDHYARYSHCTWHEYTIKFYANKAKIPTIAPPKVKFCFRFDVKYETEREMIANKDTTYIQEYSNTNYGTSMKLFSYASYYAHTRRRPVGREFETEILSETFKDVKLLDNPDYKLIDIISIPIKQIK